ncbi:MAG: hypothetical protein CYG61_09555 [Actinobacteria bacterium]|nr:MAG: hypothetical protein CYG61_09555 [Actinomycetota bacterium]
MRDTQPGTGSAVNVNCFPLADRSSCGTRSSFPERTVPRLIKDGKLPATIWSVGSEPQTFDGVLQRC